MRGYLADGAIWVAFAAAAGLLFKWCTLSKFPAARWHCGIIYL